MAKVELGVYINPTADINTRKKAEAISGPEVVKLRGREELHSMECKRILVVGGETTVGRVIDEIIKMEWDTVVGIWHAGTQGVLNKVMKDRKGLVMTVDEFREKPLHEFSRIHPGEVNGMVFINHVGFGQYENQAGKMNDICRDLCMPKPLRILISRALAGSIALVHSNGADKMEIYSIVSHIGEVEVFPNQDAFGDSITCGWVEGPVGLAVVLLELSLGITPSEKVLKIVPSIMKNDVALTFWNQSNGGTIWVDGKTIDNPFKGQRVIIRRTKRSIPITAIK